MITLETLPKATSQEVFDQVVTHLRQQGEKSISNVIPHQCLYRYKKEDGTTLKCAAGCLISDEEYVAKRMEGSCWLDLHKMTPHRHEGLIHSLQVCHDDNEVRDWEQKFQLIADEFNLTYTPS